MTNTNIFTRYAVELAIIIPDVLFVFVPVLDSLRWPALVTLGFAFSMVLVFVAAVAWLGASMLLPVIPLLVVGVSLLFLIFFFTVKINLARKLFCFFNAIMMGAFCLLYSISLMASFEAENELWGATKLLTVESGLVSLGLSVLVGMFFLKFLTEELPMLLKEEFINGIWDFLFLIPLFATLLIAWLTPIWPKILLMGRARAFMLVLQVLIPIAILLTYYLLWWISAKFSEGARLQQENTMLQMERKRYEELTKYMDETRTLRHDFRQHILVISQLSNAGNLAELQKYLSQFNSVAEKNYMRYCDNIAIDAVASYYTTFAKNQQTKIEWKLNLPQRLPLKESEYCVMLGNLIENSLRAVKDLPEDRRYVRVISSLLSETIIGISVDNPFEGKITFGKNGLPEADREGHGIGLISVLNVVKRHEGTLNITAEKNIFSVDIVLHCNN
ncbi:MAG: GHKL domain-containing protein [Synergistaceae bacterium]|nr:GHKL domain-containing protein [Synergistaceae bacterium]